MTSFRCPASSCRCPLQCSSPWPQVSWPHQKQCGTTSSETDWVVLVFVEELTTLTFAPTLVWR